MARSGGQGEGDGTERDRTVFTVAVQQDHENAEQFDLIIIGSGSGNAIPDDLADWKIAIVERGTFGGTCLNVGCIPSKMFVLPADKAVDAQHAIIIFW